jgi:5-methylcytosine-specific restriction enzyme subunit McrC
VSPPPNRLTESQPAIMRLTEAQAVALAAAGRRLASSKSWWGDPDVENEERTVIRVRPTGVGEWELRVADAVGAVAVADLQLLIGPKIPDDHLLYLFACSGQFPRLDPQHTTVGKGSSLWELVATWFVNAAEKVLRKDLIRDYRLHVATLPLVRGRIQALNTSRALLKGQVAITCEFDDFDEDNPLNRLLLAAALAVGSSQILPADLRQRSRRISLRLDGVGRLRPQDLRAVVDRRTDYYRDAVTLAKSILASAGRSLEEGPEAAWSFLIRTPEMVEAGLRQILAEGLGQHWPVTKGHLQLPGSTKTLNPDLVFRDGLAIGDVKYKLTGQDWNTGDLYQAVSFAAGYRTQRALLISFSPYGEVLPELTVGDIRVMHIPWRASVHIHPEEAASILVAEVSDWLEMITRTGDWP